MATTSTQMSVDDLVNSFGASHIGQEARDLAALQAHLAATLFASSSASNPTLSSSPFAQHQQSFASTSSFASSSSHQSHSRPRTNSTTLSIPIQRGRSQTYYQQQQQSPYQQPRCTTPLARTPSSSSYMQSYEYDEGMEEDRDERMVEDLLMPSSSSASSSSFSYQPTASTSSAFPSSPMSYAPSTSASTSYPSHPHQSHSHQWAEQDLDLDLDTTTDLFTTTDPFFLAQVQAQQAAEQARLERQERMRVGMQASASAFMKPPTAFGASMGMGGYSHGGFATASAF